MSLHSIASQRPHYHTIIVSVWGRRTELGCPYDVWREGLECDQEGRLSYVGQLQTEPAGSHPTLLCINHKMILEVYGNNNNKSG